MSLRILITGGSGFIGRNLVEYLRQSYEIFAPSHKELELTDEVEVNDYFHRYTFDTVIHSAVRPGHRNAKDPTQQLYINLRMFFNIMRNRNKFGKLIFISSGAVYDVTKPLVKVKEDFFDNYVPRDEHGFSKYIIAKHLEKLDNVVELRIFGIFGKYEDYAIRFISNAICKTIFDLPITIRQNRKMDYLYIEDLFPIIDYFLNNQHKEKAYNVTPDQSIEILELAKKIKKISGKDVPIINNNPPGVEYSGDNTRLKTEIRKLSFTPIDEAIKKLFQWYLENKNTINKEYLLIDK